MFEYLFFWFYQYYKRLYKLDDSPIYVDKLLSLSTIALCAIKILFVYSIITIVGIILVHCYSLFSFKYLAIPLIIAFSAITVLSVKKKEYYKNNINALSEKYKTRSNKTRIKGWMMFFIMIGLFLLPIVFSYVLRSVLIK